MAVHLFATLDTKGLEAAFVRDELRKAGVETAIVDCGCLGEPAVAADVPREEVFRAAGTTLDAVRARGDRGEAVTHRTRYSHLGSGSRPTIPPLGSRHALSRGRWGTGSGTDGQVEA